MVRVDYKVPECWGWIGFKPFKSVFFGNGLDKKDIEVKIPWLTLFADDVIVVGEWMRE